MTDQISLEQVSEKKEGAVTKYDQLILSLDAGSSRAKTLCAVRSFRANWINVGKWLINVAYGGDYKDWGYNDFESYCAEELGLKKPTVKKLMVSYNYMKIKEPDLLERAHVEGGDVPEYQTVNELHKASNRDELDQEKITEVHAKVFSGEMDDKEAKSAIKDIRNESTPALTGMEGVSAEIREDLDRICRAARTLRQRLARSRSVPEGLKDRIEMAIVELEALG